MEAQPNATAHADTGCHPQHHRQIQLKVDGESLEVRAVGEVADLSVREILDMSGNQPAGEYYLIEFTGEGHHEWQKHEDLEERLSVKDHARYAAVYRGCTPVS